MAPSPIVPCAEAMAALPLRDLLALVALQVIHDQAEDCSCPFRRCGRRISAIPVQVAYFRLRWAQA